jgi:DNA-binding transcriptional MerR regulator
MEQNRDSAVAGALGGNPDPVMGIGAVERDTGLTKDTLRIWERRYGFPQPLRDTFGERAYPREQVDRLRAIKRLLDAGFRPGKIMGLGLEELKALVPGGDVDVRDRLPESLAYYIDLVRAHQVEELRNALGQAVSRGGLAHFINDVVAPLNVAVGDLWVQGRMEVFEEHLYTESLQVVLRGAIAGVPRTQQAPRVLLTTVPGEQHGLGLLMAEGMLVLEGACCVSLGVETPLWDIVQGATAQAADIVALSFSQAFPPAQAVDSLSELRRHLPSGIALWAGGSASVLGRRIPEGVTAMTDLRTVQDAVRQWRARRHS